MYTNPISSHNTDRYNVYTIEAFKRLVASGCFIDYDGFGNPAKDNLSDVEIEIKPSKIKNVPLDATHIVWFNR